MTGLARVTISSPRRRVDVAVPAHLPIAELLPDLLRHAGDELADEGERHGGWLLRRADGVPLPVTVGLHAAGVRDGEILHLVPARVDWPEPAYDDVIESIAAAARRSGRGWDSGATRIAGLAAAGVAATAGLAALTSNGPPWTVAGTVGLGAAGLLTLAGTVVGRGYGDALAGAVLGGYALPYAFAGGAMVFAGDGGAPALLIGSTALVLAAVVGGVGAGAVPRLFVAGGLAGLCGAAAAVLALWMPAPGAAAIGFAALVCGVGALPPVAIRLGRLPLPTLLPAGPAAIAELAPLEAAARPPRPAGYPAPAGTAAPGGYPWPAGPVAPNSVAAPGSYPAPASTAPVDRAVRRTTDLLTGMLIGHAVALAAAAGLLAVRGGTAGRLLVLVGAVTVLLRARLFATVAQRVPVLGGGVAGLLALAVTEPARGAAGALVAVTLLTALAGLRYARRPPSPYLGRAADLVDLGCVVATIPIACAVLGLYHRIDHIT